MKSQRAKGNLTSVRTSSMHMGSEPFIDAYDIANPDDLEWDVRTYTLEPVDHIEPGHEDRGRMVSAMWDLRRQHGNRCKGRGFISDVDARTVVVSSNWDIPSQMAKAGYLVSAGHTFTARASDPQHQAIIHGILKGAVKQHFKDVKCESLGYLWQDFNSFCQMPQDSPQDGVCFCRKFSAVPVSLNGCMALHLIVSTITLDGRTLDWYYSKAKVSLLAQMICEKQDNRITRRGEKVGVRVWHDQRTSWREGARVVELVDSDEVVAHGLLGMDEQRPLASRPISCQQFGNPPEDVPRNQIRLILDTQITGDRHSETIIEPSHRVDYISRLRSFLDGMDVYGRTLQLSDAPIGASRFTAEHVLPPPVRVKGPEKQDIIIQAPSALEHEALNRRARARSANIRRHGFVLDRPIDPVLAWPKTKGSKGLNRIVTDFNKILEKRMVKYRFRGILYRNPEDLREQVEKGKYDALLAVLADETHGTRGDCDIHEEIKRRIDVPSQCIHIEHTLPKNWVDVPDWVFAKENPSLAHRIRNTYELCLDNLLVKHGWVPFVPVAPFKYNVHIGLDVGGRSNNRVVACLAYGLSQPDHDILFLPQEIPIEIGKAEPIPTGSLLTGLRQLFDRIESELKDAGQKANFDRTLFIRDGAMLGHGDDWNERDAIKALHRELSDRGVISSESTWSVAEVLKRAERWRVFSNNGMPDNPLVGYCLLDFGSPDEALVCTTGRPYLSQGTASPIKVRVSSIYGDCVARDVIHDIVWEADMGFTKPDMGHGLPWVLHVADTGALQLSRSYRISGITA